MRILDAAEARSIGEAEILHEAQERARHILGRIGRIVFQPTVEGLVIDIRDVGHKEPGVVVGDAGHRRAHAADLGGDDRVDAIDEVVPGAIDHRHAPGAICRLLCAGEPAGRIDDAVERLGRIARGALGAPGRIGIDNDPVAAARADDPGIAVERDVGPFDGGPGHGIDDDVAVGID